MLAFLPESLELACPDTYQVPWFGPDRLVDHVACMQGVDVVVANPSLWEDMWRDDDAFDAFAAERDAHLATLTFIGERAVPAGIVKLYRPQAVSIVWDSDLLAPKTSDAGVDCCYADLDDHLDLLVVHGDLPNVALLVLDRGWLTPATGVEAAPPGVPGLDSLRRVGEAYDVQLPTAEGTTESFDSTRCDEPPSIADEMQAIIERQAPVAYIATRSLRQLAWTVCAHPETAAAISAVVVVAGDADPQAQPEWNAAMDPHAFAFVLEHEQLNVTWLPPATAEHSHRATDQ